MGSMPQPTQYDVLIIGAGLSGLCSLYHIRKQFPTWRVGVLEAGAGPGGVWYWNRYPGARVDTESLAYSFSWDAGLLQEWDWPDTFAGQSDMLKYIERLCQRNNLYENIHFHTKITSARWCEVTRTWMFLDENGVEYETTFFLSCLGFLSVPTLPNVPGVHDFVGPSFHTSRWPENFNLARDFAGKRVAVIGTGATGIQTSTAVANEPSVKSLTVFQRTANWSAPLRNEKITREKMRVLRGTYDGVFRQCHQTHGSMLHQADPRKTSEVSEEDRVTLWEALYAAPGFTKWLGVFSDTYTDREANKLYSDFIAQKIRDRVRDPHLAEKLIPKGHGFGTRRVPLESNYFEIYNQDNVNLVDLQESPIKKVTSRGILLANNVEHEFDVIIYATGFDAITGAFSQIDWHAAEGRPLLGQSDPVKGQPAIWTDFRPRTLLGIMIPSMPNTFVVLGPHQPFGNAPRSIEHVVSVISGMLQYCKDNGYTRAEPTEEAVEKWTEHVMECSSGGLASEVDSWMTGVNSNVAGKTQRTVGRYGGSAVEYRRYCAECKDQGYQGIMFS